MAVNVHPALGQYQKISDFRTGADENGAWIETRRITIPVRANADITRGQALMWVAPSQTVPVSVTPMTTGVPAQRFAGVAADTVKAGDVLEVVVFGLCLALLDASDTPAEYNLLFVPDATTGRLATAATGTAACVGVEVGPETGTSTDLAVCFIGPVARADT